MYSMEYQKFKSVAQGKAISHVYSPPEFRGKRFASATVALLSQQLLDQGANYCCLFTDQKNSYSNRMYERIGYQRVGNFAEYTFS